MLDLQNEAAILSGSGRLMVTVLCLKTSYFFTQRSFQSLADAVNQLTTGLNGVLDSYGNVRISFSRRTQKPTVLNLLPPHTRAPHYSSIPPFLLNFPNTRIYRPIYPLVI
ncbi:hypothetical protein Tco_1560332, partial [Tanacetum coccineum]